MKKEELNERLREAKRDPWLFFDGGDALLKSLQRATHPDKWLDDAAWATQLFQDFNSQFELAQTPLPTFGEYKLPQRLTRGDLCDIYRSRCGKLVKVPFIAAKSANNLLAKESEVCLTLQEKAKGGTYANYFPVPAETLLLDDKRANVFEYNEHLISLADVKQRMGALSGRHIGWIFNRVLTALGFAHLQGWAHAAVTPEHILLSPADHGVVLCGWIHAESPKTLIKVVPAKWKAWYHKGDKKPSVGLDIHLAAHSMLEAADADLPPQLKAFFKGCTLSPSARPQDAWKLLEEWKELLRRVYGPPRFVPLTVPVI